MKARPIKRAIIKYDSTSTAVRMKAKMTVKNPRWPDAAGTILLLVIIHSEIRLPPHAGDLLSS
jgi:hypothetical protein